MSAYGMRFGKAGASLSEVEVITEIKVCTDSINSLQGIEKMSRLIWLEAPASEGNRGKLFEVDLSGLPNLRALNFATNPLKTIDFSHNPLLTEIYMNNVPLRELPEMRFLPLTSLHMDHIARFMPDDYLRNFPLLNGVNIGFFEGRTLDLSQNKQLDALWAYGCSNLEELDLTATPNMKVLYIGGCQKLRRVYVCIGTVFEQLEKEDHTEIIYVD